jgi:hypothetical protein
LALAFIEVQVFLGLAMRVLVARCSIVSRLAVNVVLLSEVVVRSGGIGVSGPACCGVRCDCWSGEVRMLLDGCYVQKLPLV